MAALFLLAVDAKGTFETLSPWVKIEVGVAIVQTLVWILLLYISIRYFQLNMSIERQYAYIHKLERQLQGAGLSVSREGESYLSGYPKVLDAIHVIYTWVFPLLLILLAAAKAILEWPSPYNIQLAVIIDTIIALIIIVLTILYVYSLKHKPKSSSEDNAIAAARATKRGARIIIDIKQEDFPNSA
jgi:hypothetical protein